MFAPLRTRTRLERIQEIKAPNKVPLSFCIPNLTCEDNFAMLIRTAVAMGFFNAYIIGSYTSWKELKRISCNTCELINIKQFSNPEQFTEYARNNNIRLIAIEKNENSQSIKDYRYYEKLDKEEVCLCLGHETLGIPVSVLQNIETMYHIDMYGPIPCLNVAVAGSIAMNHIRGLYKN